jgi:hypothetical protein
MLAGIVSRRLWWETRNPEQGTGEGITPSFKERRFAIAVFEAGGFKPAAP